MGFWSNMEGPTNILMICVITSLYVLDKNDEEERIYLKSILFTLGCIGIINVYRYSKLGTLIDEILESEIFLKKELIEVSISDNNS